MSDGVGLARIGELKRRGTLSHALDGKKYPHPNGQPAS
jgi:hypothetical protein